MFLKTMQHIREGGLLSDLDHELHDAIAVVKHTGRKAKITLTLTIIPNDAVVRTVKIEDDVKAALPKIPKASSVFFPTETNDLVVEDPLQRKLELREVASEAKAAPRELAAEAAPQLREAV